MGQGGRRFRIIKFRSMTLDAETQTGPIWAENHDKRCTGIGEWLRHTNIDELPQLINVLIGDMSLVGPRPERPIFVDKFLAEVPDYEFRHAVPVGMTGWRRSTVGEAARASANAFSTIWTTSADGRSGLTCASCS